MRNHIATTLGFLLTPLFVAIALSMWELRKIGGEYLSAQAINFILLFYSFSLSISLVIGLPIYLILSRYGKVNWWSAILAGAFSSTVFAAIFSFLNPLVISIGGASGFIFWLIWKQGRRCSSNQLET